MQPLEQYPNMPDTLRKLCGVPLDNKLQNHFRAYLWGKIAYGLYTESLEFPLKQELRDSSLIPDGACGFKT